MPMLMLKDLPRYECLLEAAREFPELDPSATEAFLHLLRTGDDVFRLMEAHLAGHDISQGRFGVLMALARCEREKGRPCLTPAELAERTGVTRATMTGLIDTLARDGLVTREPHPDDRRMMSVQLTEAAENRLMKILPSHFQKMAWLLEPLDETERRTLVTLLLKIQRRVADALTAPATEMSAGTTSNR